MKRPCAVLTLSFLALAALMILVSIPSDSTYDEKTYFSDGDGFIYEITSSQAVRERPEVSVYSYSNDIDTANVAVKAHVNYDSGTEVKECDVTRIANYCFEDNGHMETLFIPATVKSVESFAIMNCPKLSAFTVDPSNVQFDVDGYGLLIDKISLTTAIRSPPANPKGSIDATPYTVLNPCTFLGCTKLKSIELNPALRIIDGHLFQDCTALEKINYKVVSGYNYLPSEIVFIGDSAFSGCSSLTSLILPENLRVISNGAFADCCKIERLEINSDVSSISYGAFAGCSGLTVIFVTEENEHYQTIDGVLYDRGTGDRLELHTYPAGKADARYEIPESASKIVPRAFSGCVNLREIVLPSHMTIVNSEAFTDMKSLERVELGPNVAIIDNFAFSGCRNLKEVKMTDTLTVINFGAFESCSSLTDIVLSEKLKTIGEIAFSNTDSLKTLVIPESVGTIGEYAFSVSGLEKITLLGRPDLGRNCFDTYGTVTVVHHEDFSIPDNTYSDHTTLIDEYLDRHVFPTSNIVGIAVCILIMIGIIYLFRKI